MIKTSESIVNFSKAFLEFQGAVDGVKRDSDNPFFKSKYADLEKVVDTARPHLQAAGLSFVQSPGAIRDGNLEMTTMLIHAESGEWLQGTGEIPLGKKDPQGAGSAQTYAQRYHLMAMLGLPPTDDDGETAMDRGRPGKSTEKAADAPKVPTVAVLKENFTRLKTELLEQQSQGWRVMAKWLNDASVLAEIEALGRYAEDFKAEARDIFDLAKKSEEEFNAVLPVSANSQPDFDNLDTRP